MTEIFKIYEKSYIDQYDQYIYFNDKNIKSNMPTYELGNQIIIDKSNKEGDYLQLINNKKKKLLKKKKVFHL